MDDIFLSVGDLSAANYIVKILEHLKDKNLSISGITDDRMENLGVKSIAKIKDLNIVGFVEVLPKIFNIKSILQKAIKQANNSKLVVLCDAPGFNLRLMKNISNKNIVYFISPQVWAWKYNRVYEIVKYVKHLILILPFEIDIYKPFENEHFKVRYFGHPILDILPPPNKNKENIIAMLPGSRNSEFKKHIKLLEEISYEIYQNYHLKSLIPLARTIDYEPKNTDYMIFTKESSIDIMNRAMFGIIASGTASLEAATLGLPHIIFYRVNPISLMMAKRLVKSKYIGLPNLIMDKLIIPELIQPTKEDILKTFDFYMKNQKALEDMKSDLSNLYQKLLPKNATLSIANFLLSLV